MNIKELKDTLEHFSDNAIVMVKVGGTEMELSALDISTDDDNRMWFLF